MNDNVYVPPTSKNEKKKEKLENTWEASMDKAHRSLSEALLSNEKMGCQTRRDNQKRKKKDNGAVLKEVMILKVHSLLLSLPQRKTKKEISNR